MVPVGDRRLRAAIRPGTGGGPPLVVCTSLPVLRLIRQPALILAGDDDPIIPLANARLMAALLPDARLHVYPDGHLGLLTRAAELAPEVSDFLLSVEPGARRAVQ